MNDESLSDVFSNLSDSSYMSDLDLDECQSLSFDLSNGSPININNFNIVHFNINSITAENRLDQLSDICQTLNGCLIYIAEYLVFQHKPEYQSDLFEHLWVDIRLKNIVFSINVSPS